MRTVVFDVVEEPKLAALSIRRMKAAVAGKKQPAHISFTTPALMFQIMTENRWAIINAMLGAEAMSVRELTRRLERDVKAVHTDVQQLLKSSILRKTKDGKIEFPYDTIHVDFIVHAATAAA